MNNNKSPLQELCKQRRLQTNKQPSDAFVATARGARQSVFVEDRHGFWIRTKTACGSSWPALRSPETTLRLQSCKVLIVQSKETGKRLWLAVYPLVGNVWALNFAKDWDLLLHTFLSTLFLFLGILLPGPRVKQGLIEKAILHLWINAPNLNLQKSQYCVPSTFVV